MFKDKIRVEKGFQTSVNIAYDLNNEKKLRDFIPTAVSIDIVEDILLSTSTGAASRARILIGAYGKGKSHIMLMLVSLLILKDILVILKLHCMRMFWLAYWFDRLELNLSMVCFI